MGNHQSSETKMDKGKDYDNLDTNRFIFFHFIRYCVY